MGGLAPLTRVMYTRVVLITGGVKSVFRPLDAALGWDVLQIRAFDIRVSNYIGHEGRLTSVNGWRALISVVFSRREEKLAM